MKERVARIMHLIIDDDNAIQITGERMTIS